MIKSPLVPLLSISLIALLACSEEAAGPYPAPNAETPVARVITEVGEFYILLHESVNPETVANFVELADNGFYDGIGFHRVEPGGVIQAGCPHWDDPTLAGTGGPGYTIPFENATLSHLEGAVGLARAADPDSGGSQFYVCLNPLPQLDGDYVVFGQVVGGMEVVYSVVFGTVIEDVEPTNWGEFIKRAARGELDLRPRRSAESAAELPELDISG
ncbi:MAG: peptidylprolyl isomerase [Candidatus Coatesbacteria bacterium]|nr:peptidylprolyl isomerase [Candidatus Coatesbacteria bacterium]